MSDEKPGSASENPFFISGTPYSVLGTEDRRATEESLRKAHRRKIHAILPNMTGRTEAIVRADAALATLLDPFRRAAINLALESPLPQDLEHAAKEVAKVLEGEDRMPEMFSLEPGPSGSSILEAITLPESEVYGPEPQLTETLSTGVNLMELLLSPKIRA